MAGTVDKCRVLDHQHIFLLFGHHLWKPNKEVQVVFFRGKLRTEFYDGLRIHRVIATPPGSERFSLFCPVEKLSPKGNGESTIYLIYLIPSCHMISQNADVNLHR